MATEFAGLNMLLGALFMNEHRSSPSQANDVVSSVSVAQVAFAELSKHFAVIGHS